MKNLDLIAEELFNKIRGRFPSVTLGDGEGKVTNVPTDARFFDFDYKEGAINLGKVSVSLTENSVEIMYSDSFVSEQDDVTKENWYNFLKEMRQFSKKRLMTFDTRNINKSNLDKRDYKFLAQNRGEETMSESKMYGTNRVSYQKVDGARIVVKHNESINADIAGGRTRSIGKIYIESADGERFMYPFKHLSGARAMARHVAEGGKPFDEFGTHIVGLSEEMNKLRKFKSYMGRSAVMAESLAGYTSVVNDRIKSVKKTIESLQKSNYYAEAIGSFEASVMEDVPADVKENWIDQLTIKQFNEELSDVFPYIYKLVSEASKAEEINPDDLDESGLQRYTGIKKYGKKGFEELQKAGREGAGEEEKGKIKDKYLSKEEAELEQGFDDMMGQFGEGEQRWKQTSMSPEEAVSKYGKENVKVKKGGLRNGDDMVSVLVADESFDPSSEPSKADAMADEFMSAYERGGEEALAKAMGMSDQELDQEITEYGMEHGLHADDDRDDIIQGVIEEIVDNMDEGNAYAHAVKKAKMNGKKKGDKVDGPDGDEITIEKDEKTPLGEFILSYYDRENGTFPKGETAVLTMIEKDYGEEFIEPAKTFIEKINQTFEEFQMRANPQQMETDSEYDRMRELAGIR